MTFSITKKLTLSTIALNTAKLFVIYAECYLCLFSFMLSVTNKPIMLSVIILNVVMLNAIMSVFMLNVVAPWQHE